MAFLSAGAAFGPNRLRSAEYVFGAAEPLGLDIDRTTVAVITLQSYVRGYAISELAGVESLRRSGVDKEQRREACGPYIQQITESGDPLAHPDRPRGPRPARGRGGPPPRPRANRAWPTSCRASAVPVDARRGPLRPPRVR
jgi:hypothetical protein